MDNCSTNDDGDLLCFDAFLIEVGVNGCKIARRHIWFEV